MAWQHENDCTDERVYQASRTEAWLWQHAKQLGLSRRRLVQLLVAGGAAATWGKGRPRSAQAQTAAGQELVVKSTPPERFFDYGTNKVWCHDATPGFDYTCCRAYNRCQGIYRKCTTREGHIELITLPGKELAISSSRDSLRLRRAERP